ncbi:MAG: cysteine hydrolase family protein [Devosia sp.]
MSTEGLYRPRFEWRDEDFARLAAAGFGRRMGLGERPAVVCIDAQRYMFGEEGRDHEYPSSCGPAGRRGLARIADLLAGARQRGWPVIFTRFEVDNEADMGAYRRKRAFRNIQNWCVTGTPGAQIEPVLGPLPGDLVIVKKKPSAFFGTPLLPMLVDRGVDTVIICGGATSNCVRASVFDSSSYNFRTIVVADAVIDRVEASHEMSLFDMDRQFADVMTLAELFAAAPAGGPKA